MAKKEEVLQIPAIEFLDNEGKTITLDKVLEKGDYWNHKSRKGDSWILSHKGIEKIAKIAGIKPQINTKFTLEVQPSYQNGMGHEVVASMICEAYTVFGKDIETNERIDLDSVGKALYTEYKPGKCFHKSDSNFFSTGESSRLNTGSRGGSYMRIMAEKRAYDRGVLQHLGINGNVNIYSEDEAESFEEQPATPIDSIIEKLSSVLNDIINTTTKEDLKRVGENIRKMELSEEEKAYLRTIWLRQNNTFIETF
jgi:hypothetical protein